ncbi:YVTN repeat-like/Quino protein amine dehydrogenase [Suillus brevipes Sb2]|nr:YVTN repeat-like/Quino protein amine dehydrogenase [Suillus brevipes Sb2]
MASTSTQPIATADKSILTSVMTLEGHEPWNIPRLARDDAPLEGNYVSCMSYFPDGLQMISGSWDKTIRQWDLQKGKELEKNRQDVKHVGAVGVSRNGRWVVIASDEGMKVSEVETGIVRTFDDSLIWCIDISADSTLLAGASPREARIWNLDTGELVAGPFDIGNYIPEALRFSEDSRKLAVRSYSEERYLQVWDVQTQKLDVQKSAHSSSTMSSVPIFWTTKDKSIVAAFKSPDDTNLPVMIYEFDALTLKTVGAPFNTLLSYAYGV